MEESIAYKTAKTSFWGGLEKIFVLGFQFLITMVLARLLMPEDYAVIAMLTIFIEISKSIVDSGVSSALVRKNKCTEADYSTAFYLNLTLGLLMYGVLFLSAPLISRFYELPLLTEVLRYYSLSVIISSLGIVQNARLTRALEFKKIAIITSTSTFLTGVVAILFAYYGFGVWSLVIQGISTALFTLILLFVVDNWFPKLLFDRKAFSYLWNFGSKMLLTGIISTIYNNLYSVIIGKAYDAKTLGFFNRAQQTSGLFPNILQSVFSRNALPILSQLNNEENKQVDVYRKFVILISFVGIPFSFFLAVLSEPFIITILTEKWRGTIIYLQLFSVSSFLVYANTINLTMFLVRGRSDIMLKAEIIKKTICTIVVIAMIPAGPFWLAITACFVNVFTYGVNIFFSKRIIGVGFTEQMKDLLPSIISAAVASFFIWGVTLICVNYIMQMIIGALIGIGVYYIVSKYYFRMQIYSEISNFIKDYIPQK